MAQLILTTEIDGVKITLEGTFAAVLEFLRRVLSYIPDPAQAITFLYEGKEISMLTMTDTQQAEVTLVIKDKNGKPAAVDGIPVWSTSDTAVAGVVADATGMKATVKSNGSGVCQITVDVDADLGSGVKPIIGFLDVTVLGQASVIELVPGAITDQP